MTNRWSIVALLGLAACGGGNPTGPADPQPAGGGLQFIESAYAVNFVGDSLACGDVKNPNTGLSVGIRMTLRRDATGWTANHATETAMLRFEPASTTPSPAGPAAIVGVARGSAQDEGVVFDPGFSVPANGTRITFADNAALSGAMQTPQLTDSSGGTINGTVSFSRDGVTSTCPAGAVRWTISRRQS